MLQPMSKQKMNINVIKVDIFSTLVVTLPDIKGDINLM